MCVCVCVCVHVHVCDRVRVRVRVYVCLYIYHRDDVVNAARAQLLEQQQLRREDSERERPPPATASGNTHQVHDIIAHVTAQSSLSPDAKVATPNLDPKPQPSTLNRGVERPRCLPRCPLHATLSARNAEAEAHTRTHARRTRDADAPRRVRHDKACAGVRMPMPHPHAARRAHMLSCRMHEPTESTWDLAAGGVSKGNRKSAGIFGAGSRYTGAGGDGVWA